MVNARRYGALHGVRAMRDHVQCREHFPFMTPRPPGSTLFPYTTLFRSGWNENVGADPGMLGQALQRAAEERGEHRSEEHTSELQSHSDLVCRLLLEKKKTPRPTRTQG